MNGIGIDVSKRQLDIGTTDGETLQVSNNRSGFSELDVWLKKRPTRQIVLEATGGYEQPVLDFLHKAGHPVALSLIHIFAFAPLFDAGVLKPPRWLP
ncbi:IS110 family transposase, partial [Stenotrophomonas maltophilia]|uniref:IS110 family transposase n=1 Tax=Stenotrophomonas maltophilia TaxID=40324 RepID=UPI000ABE4DD9